MRKEGKEKLVLTGHIDGKISIVRHRVSYLKIMCKWMKEERYTHRKGQSVVESNKLGKMWRDVLCSRT